MESNFAVALNHVLVHEGGYTDHPRDPGGATNKGVIQRVYDAYRRRHGLTPRSVAFIADHEITAIYRTQYWNKIEGDALPKGIDYCVFDAAVNSGPARGARWLQKAINKCAGYKRVKVDQDIGSATLDAADDYPPHDLINAMCDIRVGFLRRLSTFDVFGRGWLNRVLGYLPRGATLRRANGVDDIARGMADNVPTQNKPVLPDPGIKTDEVPSWLLALLAAAAAIIGGIVYG